MSHPVFFDTFSSRVRLAGILTAETALRVGAGRSTAIIGSDLPVVRDGLDLPYIPGSSFKGALRAGIEALLRAVDPRRACNPLDEDEVCVAAEGIQRWERARREGKLTDLQVAQKIYDASCDACRLFGSNGIAARVLIRDLLVDKELWFGQYEVRNGVSIERDTETAAAGRLYDFEVVPAGTQFRFELVVENPEPWQLGLLLAGLRTFIQGEASLGGARSRGLGRVRLQLTERTQVTAASLLDWLSGGEPAAVTEEDLAGWRNALRQYLSAQRETTHA